MPAANLRGKMPEHLRALVVVLIASIVGFAAIKPFLLRSVPQSEPRQFAKFWIVVLLLAFLSHDIYVFLILTAGYLALAMPARPVSRISLYVLLMLAIPNVGTQLPGFGIINYLIELTYLRVLTLTLLLPLLFFHPTTNLATKKFDKYFLAIFFLCSVLDFRDVSFTEGIRRSVCRAIDMLIPYYSVSRTINSSDDVREVFSALLIPMFTMSILAVAEVLKSWHFYAALPYALGVPTELNINAYKQREGFLRASVALGAVPFGYFSSLAICVILYFKNETYRRATSTIVLVLLGGVFVTFSRGPWVSLIVMALAWFTLERRIGSFLRGCLLIGVIAIPLIWGAGMGSKVLRMLPILGGGESQMNVDYREQLFQISIGVANRSPLFGSTDFLKQREMQPLLQGEGIIDIVNTYLQYLLQYGYVGLFLFVSLFLVALYRCGRARGIAMQSGASEVARLCNVLIAMLLGTMVVIATVSSLGHGAVSAMYWLLISLAVVTASKLPRNGNTET